MRKGFFIIFLILLVGCQPADRINPAKGLAQPYVIGKYQAGAVQLEWDNAESLLGAENARRIIETEQFVIEMSQQGPDLLADFQTVGPSSHSFFVAELTNDQPYYFAVRAEGKGYSLRSNVIMIIPRPLPQQQSLTFSDTITNRTPVELTANFYGSFLWLNNSGPTANIPFANKEVLDSLKDWGATSFLWSPQHDRLAFAQGIGLSSGEKWGHIGIYRLADDSVFTLTDPDNYYDHQPAWSPDGNWIAYISDEQEGMEYHIWKVKADGSTRLPLSEDQGDLNELIHKPWRSPGYPVFAPQGDTIAFERQKPLGDGYVHSLYEIPASGGSYAILHDSPWNDRKPVYSPAGDRVAFFSDRSGKHEIWLLDRSTHAVTQLSGGVDMPSPDLDQGLSWSPDGRQILFVSLNDEQAQLVEVD